MSRLARTPLPSRRLSIALRIYQPGHSLLWKLRLYQGTGLNQFTRTSWSTLVYWQQLLEPSWPDPDALPAVRYSAEDTVEEVAWRYATR